MENLNYKDLPVASFENSGEWKSWLEQNHNISNGIWIRVYKKESGIASVTHESALIEALCWGWIDGQGKRYDESSYLQKFTPRGPKSTWSKRNTELVMQLEKEGRMMPAGLKQVEIAKADGRWDRAYDSPSNMKMPDDFLLELSRNKKALAFFETLNKANLYAIGWRLQTAKKPETREKRMKAILEMLAKEEKFH